MKLSNLQKASDLLARYRKFRRMYDDVCGFPARDAYLMTNGEKFLISNPAALVLLEQEEKELSDESLSLGVEFDE